MPFKKDEKRREDERCVSLFTGFINISLRRLNLNFFLKKSGQIYTESSRNIIINSRFTFIPSLERSWDWCQTSSMDLKFQVFVRVSFGIKQGRLNDTKIGLPYGRVVLTKMGSSLKISLLFNVQFQISFLNWFSHSCNPRRPPSFTILDNNLKA